MQSVYIDIRYAKTFLLIDIDSCIATVLRPYTSLRFKRFSICGQMFCLTCHMSCLSLVYDKLLTQSCKKRGSGAGEPRLGGARYKNWETEKLN